MHILYIGAGFVGTTSGAASAASGHDVMVYDINENRIRAFLSYDRETIEECLYEEGLGELVVHNRDRLHFTALQSDMESYVDVAEAIFLCVPTPEIQDTGESDLSFFRSAIATLVSTLARRNSGLQQKRIALVIKSTVPIEALAEARNVLMQAGVRNVGIVSNPEFLVEGKAVQGSVKPDRIVVGAECPEDFALMRQVYWRFAESPTVSYIEVNPAEAAASKLLANFYLLNRLMVCFDVIGRTCEAFPDIKFEHVRKVLTTDKRIGEWGFFDSLYAGGSCLSKDSRSLAYQLMSKQQDASLIEEINKANERQYRLFMDRAEREVGFVWKEKVVALLGLSFKRDTNDVRKSASIFIAQELLAQHIAKLQIFDPVSTKQFAQIFSENEVVVSAESETKAIHGADIIIIATDWPQFRGLGDILLAHTGRPLIMDGRRILQHRYADLQQAGFTVLAVGSPCLRPNSIF